MKCTESFRWKWVATPCILLAIVVCEPSLAQAQEGLSAPQTARILPAEAYWGRAEFNATDRVTIEGRTFAFGPAVYIRDERNLMLTPYALLTRGETFVRFKINSYGHVVRLWLLTPQEIQQLPGR